MPRAAGSPLNAADYTAIEAAMQETARGRWFLEEHTRRAQQHDTGTLLQAMSRLENVVRDEGSASVGRLRHSLVDMADAIDRTKAEIAAIKPKVEHGRIEEATEELDFVMQATETATSDILAGAERIQEAAQALRREGSEAALCDALDACTTEIFTACSFQDLTGQRTRKVIQLLRFLEARIDAMIAVWGEAEIGAPAQTDSDQRGGEPVLGGPSRPGEGMQQADIDLVMGAAVTKPPAGGRPLATNRYNPLAPLGSMTYEEKVALFT